MISMKKIYIIIAIVIFILINVFINQKIKVNKIENISEEEKVYEDKPNYTANKKYEESSKTLNELSEYEKINYYEQGIQEFDNGEIISSLSYFKKSEGYGDSNTYIEKCEKIKRLIGTYINNGQVIMLSYGWKAYININNKYTETSTYSLKNENNSILIDYLDKEVKFDENFSNLSLNNIIYSKVSEYVEDKYIIYKTPKVGMTKEQVLQTEWGQPKYIDNGGTVVDKNNKKRTNGEWDESWYYKRNGNDIFIDFKNGKVIRFLVSKKGDITTRIVTDVEGY